MVPQTYPSILNPYTNRHEMVVKQLASTSGLQRWTDYIPVKLSASTRPAGEQTTDSDGFIAINTSQNTSTGVAFKDWVPVYFDNDATDAWVVSASGYIPIGASGGAIAILKSYGTDAHVYLPGADGVAVSGLPTNNYTLSGGSTGYSAVDGTAGLVLDAAGSVGAEQITGICFGNNGWTPAFSGGVASGVKVSNAAVGSMYYPTTGMSAGTMYCMTVVVSAISGTLTPSIGGLGLTAITTPGTYVRYGVYASGSYNYLDAAALTTATVDSWSIKPVTGTHVTQSTTANKPALRRGLYNLLTYSNDFSNAAWVTANWTNAASDIADPFGGTSGRKLSATAVAASLTRGDQVATSTVHTFAVVFKPGTYANPSFLIRNATTSTNLTSPLGYTANGSGSDSFGTWEYADFGSNGWKICRITCTSGITVGNSLLLYFGATGGVTNGTYFYVYAGLFMSGSASVSQILAEGGIPLTTSTAASNSGAGRYSWQFDGSNDSLALGSVPFQMSDDHCVIAGFRADAMGKVVVIPGSNVTGHRIAAVMTEGATGKARVSWWDGTNHNAIDSGSSVVGSTIVVAGRKVSSALVARLNGSQFGTATATATFIPDRAYIGTSDGGAYAHSGAIGPVILIKGTVSDSDLLTLERWVASLTPNGPSF